MKTQKTLASGGTLYSEPNASTEDPRFTEDTRTETEWILQTEAE